MRIFEGLLPGHVLARVCLLAVLGSQALSAETESLEYLEFRGCSGIINGYRLYEDDFLYVSGSSYCTIRLRVSGESAPREFKLVTPNGRLLTGTARNPWRDFVAGSDYYGVYTAQVDDSPSITFTFIPIDWQRPELAVGSLEISPPNGASPAAVTITGQIRNLSLAASGPFSWSLLSDGVVLTSGRISGLEGRSSSEPLRWEGQLSEGTHQVALAVDTADEISEYSEPNNVRTVTFNAGPGFVDLVSEVVVEPIPAQEGQPVKISGIIRNRGSNTSPPFDWALRAGETIAGFGRQVSLAPGATLSAPLQWTGILKPGSSLATLSADSSFEIAESSESNNSTNFSFAVVPRLDLKIAFMPVIPRTPVDTGATTISATISNLGYETFGAFNWTLSIGDVPRVTGQALSLGQGAALPVQWSGTVPAGQRSAILEVTPQKDTPLPASPKGKEVLFFTVVEVSSCQPPKAYSGPVELTVPIGDLQTLRAPFVGTPPFEVLWYLENEKERWGPYFDTGLSFFTDPIYAPATYWIRATNMCGSLDAPVANISLAPPAFTADGVSIHDRGSTGMVPGSISTIYGTSLTTARNFERSGPGALPESLAGTSVEINGRNVPILLVAGLNVTYAYQRVDFQVPWELPPAGTVSVTVSRDGVRSAVVPVPMRPVLPVILPVAIGGGPAVHSDYRPVTRGHAAHANETLIIFLTGLGAVTTPQVTGEPAAGAVSTVVTPRVTLGGQDARVAYSGLAPGSVGKYQINFEVPASLGAGDWPLVVESGMESYRITVPVR